MLGGLAARCPGVWGGSVSRGSCCSLIQLEGFLSALCCSCEAAHRVLYWENPAVSSQ